MSMEQFKTLLENSQGLTDDFKKSAEPLFEQAVESLVAERLEEECKKAVDKAIKEKEEKHAQDMKDAEEKAEAEKTKAVEEAVSLKAKEIKESFEGVLSENAEKIVSLEESIATLEEEHAVQIDSMMEQVDAYADEKAQEVSEAMLSRVDSYLDFVVEQFINDHKKELVAEQQVMVSNAFMNDLSTLFAHYRIEKPEALSAVHEELEGLKEDLARVNKDLSEQLMIRQSLEEQIDEFKKQTAIREIAESKALSESERDKLESFMEGFNGTIEDFTAKAKSLAESFESPKGEPKQIVTQSAVIEESKVEPKVEPLTEAQWLAQRMSRLYKA